MSSFLHIVGNPSKLTEYVFADQIIFHNSQPTIMMNVWRHTVGRINGFSMAIIANSLEIMVSALKFLHTKVISIHQSENFTSSLDRLECALHRRCKEYFTLFFSPPENYILSTTELSKFHNSMQQLYYDSQG